MVSFWERKLFSRNLPDYAFVILLLGTPNSTIFWPVFVVYLGLLFFSQETDKLEKYFGRSTIKNTRAFKLAIILNMSELQIDTRSINPFFIHERTLTCFIYVPGVFKSKILFLEIERAGLFNSGISFRL